MSKKIIKVMLSLVMVLSLVLTGTTKVSAATPQQDMETIKTRLKEYFLELDTIDDGAKVETCTVSNAKSYLDMIQDDGSFADVDYAATNSAANGGAWSPYLALDRLQAIAIAYHKVGNDLYQKPEVVDKLNLAIVYWGKKNPTAKNWWENQVGVQLRFSRIALFMDGIISEEAQNIIMTKLLEKKPVKYGTGQNNLWFDQNYIYHALISENASQLTDMIDNYLSYCLVIQEDDNTAEAVQVDNSFYMHGRQFYSNGYGMSMFRDMSFWIYMLRETQFALSDEVVDLMADYMIGGTSWTIRGDLLELYLGYRPYKYDVGYKNYAAEYIEPLKRMIKSDPKHASQYQSILNNIEDAKQSNGKNGNYYMWRSGYAGHMRDNYGVNIKMDSKNIVGGEWRGSWPAGQNGGQLIYWTSSAASTISVDGDEYTNIYPTFDWAHCPGTTTANRIVQDYGNYGRFTNGTDHTIGLTDGKYGSTAYVMNKKDTQATKGYFFFDDEFVALGAGINSKEKVNIHTTLNQSEANQVTVGGQSVAEDTKGKSYTTNWLHNDKIGYVFLKDTNVVVSHTKQAYNPSLWPEDKRQETPATFTAWVDHGLNPNNAEYAYIVVPGKTKDEVKAYANQIPVTVVSNTKDVQAVRHDGLKQTQINFYKAGSLEYKDGYTITVDQPCNVLIDESGDVRKITVAVSDISANQNVNVTIASGSVETVTSFVSGQLPYAGQSMTLVEGTDDRYQASSSTLGHPITMAVDGNVNTYWESVGKVNEWASFYTGNQKHLSNMEILWGTEYASAYEIYTSQNGKDYQLLTEGTSIGEKDTVELNGVYPYIKIVMKDGNGTHYQIKEVSFKTSDSLALNKPVEVSSTSTNDPGNKAPLAVDGNKGTRWSSLRNEDNNWIIVDLEKFSRIDAVNILWEGACSDNYDIEVSSDKRTWTKAKEGVKTDSSLKDEHNFAEPLYGRYVKIHSHKSRTQYGISIYELEVYGTYTKEDIALNKNVFAKTIDNLNLPTNVNDNKSNTKWMSKSQDEWIYIELKGRYNLSDMSITWGPNYATAYDVEVSQDAKNWSKVKSINGQGGTENITGLNDVEAKYVRLKLNTSSDKVYEIIDWKIYGQFIEVDDFDNVALNKKATASSVYKSQYDASKAFDGSFDGTSGNESRWVSLRQQDNTSEDRSHQWITVDLDAYYELSGVKLYWEGAGAKQYKILVSNDGKNWEEIYVENDGQPGITDVQLKDKVEARYVKMDGTKPAGEYGYSLWEFEVYGEKVRELGPESNLISLNKPVEVSSVSTQASNFVGSLAVDGDTSTRWASLRKEDDNWIIIDLEQYSRIDKININWEASCSDDYTIEVSHDKNTWEVVTEAKSNKAAGKHAIDEHVYDKPIYGRYVKIHSYKSRSFDYGVNIFEISVWGDIAEEPTQPTEVNIALNKSSKASSVYRTYESSRAFDGRTDGKDADQSRWVSLRKKENKDKDIDYQWIYVDLQHTYDIDKVVLNWEGACATDYKIQVSQNAKNWKDVAHIIDGKQGVRTISLSDVQGRYVRVECLKPAGDYGYSLWEFEVYGQRIKTPTMENLALNKPSKASSVYRTYESSRAFDGRTDGKDADQSRWVSNRKSNNEWIYVDLEDCYNVSKVIFKLGRQRC